MGRAKPAAHEYFIEACRVLGRFVPPLLLHALLVPYERIRGLPRALAPTDLPLSHVPPRPTDRPAGFLTRWAYQSRNFERWLAWLWSELWSKLPWSSRFKVDNAEAVDTLLASRPVVLTTLHTSWHFACATWLLNRGVEIGSVVIDADEWERAIARRGSGYWTRYGGSHPFLRGDARAMVRFLTPGRCFLVQIDYPQGSVVDVEWGGRTWRVSTGAFRLARLAKAAVVPIVALDDGLWRYRVHVGTPVPDGLIASGDDAASATHVLNELMPLIAQVPDQLMGWQPLPASDSSVAGEAVPSR